MARARRTGVAGLRPAVEYVSPSGAASTFSERFSAIVVSSLPAVEDPVARRLGARVSRHRPGVGVRGRCLNKPGALELQKPWNLSVHGDRLHGRTLCDTAEGSAPGRAGQWCLRAAALLPGPCPSLCPGAIPTLEIAGTAGGSRLKNERSICRISL